MCQHQATASDLPFYDILASTKNFFQVYDDIIACDLAPPSNQNPGLRLCVMPINRAKSERSFALYYVIVGLWIRS